MRFGDFFFQTKWKKKSQHIFTFIYLFKDTNLNIQETGSSAFQFCSLECLFDMKYDNFSQNKCLLQSIFFSKKDMHWVSFLINHKNVLTEKGEGKILLSEEHKWICPFLLICWKACMRLFNNPLYGQLIRMKWPQINRHLLLKQNWSDLHLIFLWTFISGPQMMKLLKWEVTNKTRHNAEKKDPCANHFETNIPILPFNNTV